MTLLEVGCSGPPADSIGVEDRIHRIKSSLDLADLIASQLGPPATIRSGRSWWHCPLPGHANGDRNPSLSADSQRWTCWSGTHEPSRGDVIDWIKATEQLSTARAIDRAAELAGGAQARPGEPTPPSFPGTPTAPPARPPTTRPVTGREADDAMCRCSVRRGWYPATATVLDLSVVRDRAGLLRIRFPFAVNSPYASHRLVDPHPTAPRWLLDSGPVPSLYRAGNLSRAGIVLVCEGITDTAAVVDARPRAPVVGAPGTRGLKAEWVEQFQGRAVVVIGDNDPAGQHFASKTAELLSPVVRRVDTLQVPPQYDDLADWRRVAGSQFGWELDRAVAAILEAEDSDEDSDEEGQCQTP